MKRLRFDNETRNNVVELVYYHDATFEVGNKYVKRWLNKIGEKQFRRLLEIRKADIKGQKPDYEESRIEKVNNIENILEEMGSGFKEWVDDIKERMDDGEFQDGTKEEICKKLISQMNEFV